MYNPLVRLIVMDNQRELEEWLKQNTVVLESERRSPDPAPRATAGQTISRLGSRIAGVFTRTPLARVETEADCGEPCA